MKSLVNILDRADLNFREEARKAFVFLCKLGFSEIEALPTLLRYRKNGVEVDVYHGRNSFEIGAAITAFGTRYTISEIIRNVEPEFAKSYHYAIAITPEGVAESLKELSALMKRYAKLALDGDPEFFSVLEKKRRSWSENYALDVLAGQLRPKASEAFRNKEYAKAVELYSRIKDRLSPAELKKLSIAERLLTRQ